MTYEDLKAGDMLEDELLAPGLLSSVYVSGVARAGAAPGRSRSRSSRSTTRHLSLYAGAGPQRRGFQRYLEETYGPTPGKSSSPAPRSPDRAAGHVAVERLADPRDGRFSGQTAAWQEN